MTEAIREEPFLVEDDVPAGGALPAAQTPLRRFASDFADSKVAVAALAVFAYVVAEMPEALPR